MTAEKDAPDHCPACGDVTASFEDSDGVWRCWMCEARRVLPADETSGEVGTGAGEGATGQDTGTAWVTRSADCPEAPAQAHLPATPAAKGDPS